MCLPSEIRDPEAITTKNTTFMNADRLFLVLKKHYITPIFSIILCFPFFIRLHEYILLFPATDDGIGYIRVLFSVHELNNERVIMPRWIPELYVGYGSPVLSFYSPATFTVASILLFINNRLQTIILCMIYVIVCIGAVGSSLLAREFSQEYSSEIDIKNNIIYCTSSFIYIGAPYPFITNIFMRGDIPESTALAILPWVWILVRRIANERHEGNYLRNTIQLAIFGSITLLIHQLSAVVFTILMGIVFVSSMSARKFAPRLISLGISSILSIGISSAFIIPIISESGAVRIQILVHDIEELLSRLTGLSEYYRYTWPYAYGWDINKEQSINGSVTPSLTQVMIIFLAACMLVLGRLRGAFARQPASGYSGTASVFLVVAACWFMNLGPSGNLWSISTVLGIVQYPWRLLGPLALGVALLGSVALANLRPAAAVVGALVMWLFMWGDSLGALPRVPAGVTPWNFVAGTLATGDYAHDRWGASVASGDGEFTPRAVDIRRPDGSLGGPVRLDRLAPPGAWVGGLAMVQSGEGYVASLHGDATRLRVVVEAGETGATLAIHQLDFPGWRATVDGARVDVQAATEVPGSGVTPGWLTLAIPPGRHEVAVWFGATWPRLLGDGVTCVTLALIGFALAREWRGGASRPVGTTLVMAGLLVLATWNLGAEALTVRAPTATSPATERVVLDVVEAVRRGDASLQSPSGARLGPDAFLDAGWLDVRPPPGRPIQVGTGRRWLYMHPPSRAAVRVRVPAGGAVLQSGIAIRPDAWEVPEGDGVHFIVEVTPMDGTGGVRTALFQRVNARANLDERRWVEVRADLGEWAGREVDLVLRTEPVDTVAYDWAGWGNPLVVVPGGILRPANGPQPPASVTAPRTWMVDQ